MKTETAINRIVNSDITDSLKVSKLQTLALRAFASSPAQKLIIATRQAIQKGGAPSFVMSDFYPKSNEEGQ